MPTLPNGNAMIDKCILWSGRHYRMKHGILDAIEHRHDAGIMFCHMARGMRHFVRTAVTLWEHIRHRERRNIKKLRLNNSGGSVVVAME